ncbi:MAG: hypothetical protein ACYTHM_06315 [Planctomycetota bacterium]|jgi:organic radical activating enzyme
MTAPSGTLAEIFLSFQGEGLLAGSPQVFIRTAGCDRACAYCDTAWARVWKGDRTEVRLAPGKRWFRPNPWRPEDLLVTLQDVGDLPLWVTGGEPLLQVDFLVPVLKDLEGKRQVGLETHALLPGPLEKVSPFLSWIAADAKLPSATGEPIDWNAFSASLHAGKDRGLFVKTVVPETIDPEEVRELLERIRVVDPGIPLVFQPVTPPPGEEGPPVSLLEELALEGLSVLREVRVLPQVHRLMGWR